MSSISDPDETGKDDDAGAMCAACYLTLSTAGFNPCDQSAPSCPPMADPTGPTTPAERPTGRDA